MCRNMRENQILKGETRISGADNGWTGTRKEHTAHCLRPAEWIVGNISGMRFEVKERV